MGEDHQQIQGEFRDKMRVLADSLDRLFNEDPKHKEIGFALFSFRFGEVSGGRVNYISNGRRSDMITAVKEWVERAERHQLELESGEEPEAARGLDT
jgi:hypothetical protein